VIIVYWRPVQRAGKTGELVLTMDAGAEIAATSVAPYPAVT